MKSYKTLLYILLFLSTILFGCKKSLYQVNVQTEGNSVTLTSSISSGQEVTLTPTVDSVNQLILSWTHPNYITDTAKGNVVINYILDMDTSSGFQTYKSFNLGTSGHSDSVLGADLNNKLIGIGCTGGVGQLVYIRVRSVFYGDTISSNTISFTATPYQTPLPALLVIGYSGWNTPTTRTNGYLLTSANKDNNYEGYINFSYASYGGANCRLLSTIDNSAYGWGTDNYTIQKFSDISAAWNLWITPCPNYMKVDVDLNALTINYTPITFYIAGDNNGWSTSATPMTFDATTNKWTAKVSFQAGNKFDFISSTWNATSSSWGPASWEICYRVDATGKLVFAGDPVWGGNSITVNNTGIYTVTLDLGGGNGNYTYSVE